MKIYVLPVSGGGFAVQLGLLKAIYEATLMKSRVGITPDLVLGSSGGNVASYLSMIGNWSSYAIMKNSKSINSNLFVESWTPPFFPTAIAYPLTNSIYRNGDGISQFFEQVYTKKSIVKTELWTGTYNTVSQKSAFFCNKHIDNAIIKDLGKNTHIYDDEPVVYMNGDISMISKVSHASASIPIITPGVMIKDELHVDGGAGYASPLIPMSSKLDTLIRTKGTSELIQIHYFGSYNMLGEFSDDIYSKSVGLVIHGTLLADRAYCLSFFRQYGNVCEEPEVYEDVDSKKLSIIMEDIKLKSYVLMLSPKNSPSLNLTHFVGSEVIDIIGKVEKDFTARVWTMNYRY